MPRIAADMLLRRGRFWCGMGLPTASAVAVFGERILAVGDDDLEALVGPATRVIDLQGRFAMPGLNDAHLHLVPMGLDLAEVDLRPSAARDLTTLLARLRERASERPPGTWVLGRGYDHYKLDERRHPTRVELDEAVPQHPVYVSRTCGHLAVCNSLALEAAGITVETPTPQGGLIEIQDGELTGLLAETAREPVKALFPQVTDDDLVTAIERAGNRCASLGITSVMDAAVGMRMGMAEIVAYQQAKRDGRLPVRAYLCLLGGSGGIVAPCLDVGLVTGTGDDLLRVGPVKLFTDGSAGVGTAAMRQPYRDGGSGLLTYDDETLAELVQRYHVRGYQLALHAIGDAAIEQVLDAYEEALAALPAPDRRHRIEHCGFVAPEQIERLVRLGVEPVPQPVFQRDFGDLYVAMVGQERAAAAYPLRRLLDAGLHPAASTDCPVCDCDPFANLHAMLTRQTDQGTVIGGHERVTHEEALHAYTWNGAYVSHAEQHKGRLAPGYLADVAVFDTDLSSAGPEAIIAARCELTLRGGEVAFDRNGMAGASVWEMTP